MISYTFATLARGQRNESVNQFNRHFVHGLPKRKASSPLLEKGDKHVATNRVAKINDAINFCETNTLAKGVCFTKINGISQATGLSSGIQTPYYVAVHCHVISCDENALYAPIPTSRGTFLCAP